MIERMPSLKECSIESLLMTDAYRMHKWHVN
jgi:hypothetical protein